MEIGRGRPLGQGTPGAKVVMEAQPLHLLPAKTILHALRSWVSPTPSGFLSTQRCPAPARDIGFSLGPCFSSLLASNPSAPQPKGILWPVLMLSCLSLPAGANLFFWRHRLVHPFLFLGLSILGTKALSLMSADPHPGRSGDEASSCGCWPGTSATGPGTPPVPVCVCMYAMCDVCVRCVCVCGMCLV